MVDANYWDTNMGVGRMSDTACSTASGSCRGWSATLAARVTGHIQCCTMARPGSR
jgi:hypothetical protein